MTTGANGVAPEATPARRAGTRLAIGLAVGTAAGLVAAWASYWQAALLWGWDAAAATYLIGVWSRVSRFDAARTRRLARSEDSASRLSDGVVILAGVAQLAAVGLALLKAGNAHGATEAYLITLGVGSVALSWAAVHTVFTLRYAHRYYTDPVGGVDFNEDEDPTYLDFAYLAFTIGMTFQVSDTNLTDKKIRRVALAHGLLSFVYGAVILGLTINVVAGLLH